MGLVSEMATENHKSSFHYFRWIVPGWRMGWILIQDRNEIFAAEVRQGLVSLSQRILGPNTLVQAAIPDILDKVPSTFYSDTIAIVQVKQSS